MEEKPTKTKLEIDWEDVSLAMLIPLTEVETLFDLKTGKVRLLDAEDITGVSDLTTEEVDADPDRYVGIEPPASWEAYAWMERFAEGVEDNRVREVLFRALSQKRPFRRFKDALAEYPVLLDEWNAFNETCMQQYISEWAEGLPVEIMNPPKWRESTD